VDFTIPDQVLGNVRLATSSGVHVVIGATGWDTDELRAAVEGAPGKVFAARLAIGAVLMMRFAQEAARYLPHCEIIEMHHDQKLDAPSGTALLTAKMIAGERGNFETGAIRMKKKNSRGARERV